MRELHKKRRTLKIVSGESDSGKWWGSRGNIFEQDSLISPLQRLLEHINRTDLNSVTTYELHFCLEIRVIQDWYVECLYHAMLIISQLI